LPYPKLSTLYEGKQAPTFSPLAPQAWLDLFDLGWSIPDIAAFVDQPLDLVDRTLNVLSMGPVTFRKVPVLPKNKDEAEHVRDTIRLRFKQGWSVPRLAHEYFYLSESYISTLVHAPYETRRTKPPKRRKLHDCLACKKRIPLTRKFCSDACGSRYRYQERRAAEIGL
jgi:hypothetical protein